MKRTELQRKKAMNRRSVKGQSYADELDAITPLLMARAHNLCECCRAKPVAARHHRLRRSQGGTNDLSNLLAVCDDCHVEIHLYPQRSYENGSLIRRDS